MCLIKNYEFTKKLPENFHLKITENHDFKSCLKRKTDSRQGAVT